MVCIRALPMPPEVLAPGAAFFPSAGPAVADTSIPVGQTQHPKLFSR